MIFNTKPKYKCFSKIPRPRVVLLLSFLENKVVPPIRNKHAQSVVSTRMRVKVTHTRPTTNMPPHLCCLRIPVPCLFLSNTLPALSLCLRSCWCHHPCTCPLPYPHTAFITPPPPPHLPAYTGPLLILRVAPLPHLQVQLLSSRKETRFFSWLSTTRKKNMTRRATSSYRHDYHVYISILDWTISTD